VSTIPPSSISIYSDLERLSLFCSFVYYFLFFHFLSFSFLN
jgi:hypothetical protein